MELEEKLGKAKETCQKNKTSVSCLVLFVWGFCLFCFVAWWLVFFCLVRGFVVLCGLFVCLSGLKLKYLTLSVIYYVMCSGYKPEDLMVFQDYRRWQMGAET